MSIKSYIGVQRGGRGSKVKGGHLEIELSGGGVCGVGFIVFLTRNLIIK